jgi:hypothetical protein
MTLLASHTIPVPGNRKGSTKVALNDTVRLNFLDDGDLKITNGDAFTPPLEGEGHHNKGEMTNYSTATSAKTVTLKFKDHAGKHHKDTIEIS